MTFEIRRYRDSDDAAVRDLFVRINRELSRPDLRDAFESYVAVSLRDEIDRLADYYAERQGAFFVVHDGDKLAGVFGIERLGVPAAELRRMYVDAAYRRQGLARMMLEFAEQACREAGTRTLTLSTSELQQAALAFYRASGYRLVSEETGAAQSNKTVGNIRRYHLEKNLARS
ncbi:MAG: GNAT family N-acetyltransferase [Alphaproteobacteria bacterium]